MGLFDLAIRSAIIMFVLCYIKGFLLCALFVDSLRSHLSFPTVFACDSHLRLKIPWWHYFVSTVFHVRKSALLLSAIAMLLTKFHKASGKTLTHCYLCSIPDGASTNAPHNIHNSNMLTAAVYLRSNFVVKQ